MSMIDYGRDEIVLSLRNIVSPDIGIYVEYRDMEFSYIIHLDDPLNSLNCWFTFEAGTLPASIVGLEYLIIGTLRKEALHYLSDDLLLAHARQAALADALGQTVTTHSIEGSR